MSTEYDSNSQSSGPVAANVGDAIKRLEEEPGDEELLRRAEEAAGAIAFVHFDPSSARSSVIEALVHHGDLTKIHRGLYVLIFSTKDQRRYSGRIVEGPFYNPDALKRDSTPIQFIILNQGKGKVLSVPEYHGWIRVEILGEERSGTLLGAVRRPHPASPVLPYDASMMSSMLNLDGDIRIGMLDNYEDVFVQIDSNNKGVIPRNWLTVGTIGSGKSNTTQVFTEETLEANYAQIVVDPEGEYIFMDRPSESPSVEEDLEKFERAPQGVKSITVYRPPGSESKRTDAIEFSVPFDSLSPAEMKIYCHKYAIEPLTQDQHDAVSYGALMKKLRELQMMRLFDRKDAPMLDMVKLTQPGHLSVIDMSDSREQQVVNIVIADLLARVYHYKMGLTEEQNTERKVILTIEEAHGFVSRDKKDRMEQTLDQLRRIARRGRKRWLALHFVTQSPQHLPSELFELANNKIIHQTTGSENLRVLKAAAGTVNEALWDDVPSLGRWRAIVVVSGQYPHPIMVQIRPAASRRNYTI